MFKLLTNVCILLILVDDFPSVRRFMLLTGVLMDREWQVVGKTNVFECESPYLYSFHKCWTYPDTKPLPCFFQMEKITNYVSSHMGFFKASDS